MAQHMYRAMDFQVWFALEEYAKFDSGELLLGVDVAKTAFYAAITQHGSDAYDVVYFERDDIRTFIEMLAELEFLDITLVMEPTGTYGDPLLEQAHKAGFKVARINGDRVADARKVFDGTDSLHDGKAAWETSGRSRANQSVSCARWPISMSWLRSRKIGIGTSWRRCWPVTGPSCPIMWG